MPAKKKPQEAVEAPVESPDGQGPEQAHEAADGPSEPGVVPTVPFPSEVDLRGPGTQPEHPVDSMPPLVVTPERGDAAMERSDEAQQFPALRGKPEVEVAERSADGSEGLRFVKQFVLRTTGALESWINDEAAHVGHKLRTLEEAAQRGLHAKGEVSFDGAEPHQDGYSTVLTYSVETTPAVTDTDAASTQTVSNNETTGDCPTRDELTSPETDTE